MKYRMLIEREGLSATLDVEMDMDRDDQITMFTALSIALEDAGFETRVDLVRAP